jgi:hypothetical protein
MTETSDLSPESPDCLLKLGRRALTQLDLQARVARVEARKAELEILVELAERGQTQELQNWLVVNGKYLSTESIGSEQTDKTSPVLPGKEIESWDQLLGHSLDRLQELRANLQGVIGRPIGQSLRVDKSHRTGLLPLSVSTAGESQQSLADDLVPGRDGEVISSELELSAADAAGGGAALASGEEVIPPHRAEASVEVESPLELAVAAATDLPEAADPPTALVTGLDLTSAVRVERKNDSTKSKLRGMTISAVVHIAVLVGLALMTLDSPLKDGLLSLVASEATSEQAVESFQISAPMEVTEPTTEETTVEPTTQADPLESLPNLSDTISQAMAESLASSAKEPTTANVLAAKSELNKDVVSFYGAKSSGNSFCFVLDGSGSMRGGPWEAARIELLKSINSLKPKQRFYIIFFNQEIHSLTDPSDNRPAPHPLAATPENIAHAKRWLDSMQIMAGEPPVKALETALQIECDCIYFLADGEMSDNVAKRVLESLRKHNRVNDIIDGEVVVVPIHTIAYYSDKGIDVMKAIAGENRGQFAYVPKPNSKSGK